MGTVIAHMSMSLDGYVEGPSGSVDEVFAWMQNGTNETEMPGDGRVFRTSESSADYWEKAVSGTGAMICGRRLFDLTRGWGGRHPGGFPVFVVTHAEPGDWAHPDAPFTFVTDGVASAVAQAQAAAGERAVAIATPDLTRQCLDLGLLDAVAVDLVPVLLGGGKPFFAGLAATPSRLEGPTIVEGHGVTHLRYDVRREAAR